MVGEKGEWEGRMNTRAGARQTEEGRENDSENGPSRNRNLRVIELA